MKDVKLSEFEGIEEGRVMDLKGKAFTQIPNYIIMDERLNGTAKFVLSYALLRSGLERWEIRKKDVIKHTKEKRSAIDTAFELLIENGYLVQSELYRDSKTGLTKRKYKFYKDPANNPYYNGQLPQSDFYNEKGLFQKKNPTAGEPLGSSHEQEKTSTNSIQQPTEIANKKKKKFSNYTDTVSDFEAIE